MTNPKDIISITKELQAGKCSCEPYEGMCCWCRDLVDAFPAIAQALLDRDAKLKIAVEVLEDFADRERKGGIALDNAQRGLFRIRSLPQ